MNKIEAVGRFIQVEVERRGMSIVERDGCLCHKHPFKNSYTFTILARPGIVLHMEVPVCPVGIVTEVLDAILSTQVEILP